jgi:hypothetical protein
MQHELPGSILAHNANGVETRPRSASTPTGQQERNDHLAPLMSRDQHNGPPTAPAVTRRPRPLRSVPRGLASGGGKVEGTGPPDQGRRPASRPT